MYVMHAGPSSFGLITVVPLPYSQMEALEKLTETPVSLYMFIIKNLPPPKGESVGSLRSKAKFRTFAMNNSRTDLRPVREPHDLARTL
jgi:hypothetical protein